MPFLRATLFITALALMPSARASPVCRLDKLAGDEAQDQLETWLRQQAPAGQPIDVELTEAQENFLIAQMPAELRASLFSETFEKTQAKLEALFRKQGLSEGNAPALFHWVRRNVYRYGSVGPAPEQAWAQAARQVADWSIAQRTQVAEETRLRLAVAEAKRRLQNDRDPHYRIRVGRDQVQFPDGTTYSMRKTWSGKLKVMVPYRNLIHQQEYLNSDLVGYYTSGWFLGWLGFSSGHFAPDGRYVLHDAHHHTKAYALKHIPAGGTYEDTLIPILLSPAKDGNYYTATHWSVMATPKQVPLAGNANRWNADPTWSFLRPADRDRLLREAQANPAAAARPFYYSSTGLHPLAKLPDEN